MSSKLKRSFFLHPTLVVGKDLLGKYLIFQKKSAKIVEVEAYIGKNDLACHARFGKTNRNAVMFGPGGFAYIYFVYGMHHMLNITTEKNGFPAAVLIRAVEYPASNGPGKLTRAFGITTSQNGLDLTRSALYIEDRSTKISPEEVAQTPRIGIGYAGKWAQKPWRFIVKDSLYLSRKVR